MFLAIHWVYLSPSQLPSYFTVIVFFFFFHYKFVGSQWQGIYFCLCLCLQLWHGASTCHWLATQCGFHVGWDVDPSDSSCHKNTGPKLSGLKQKSLLSDNGSIDCLGASWPGYGSVGLAWASAWVQVCSTWLSPSLDQQTSHSCSYGNDWTQKGWTETCGASWGFSTALHPYFIGLSKSYGWCQAYWVGR